MKKFLLLAVFTLFFVPNSWAYHKPVCKTKFNQQYKHAYHGHQCGYWCQKRKAQSAWIKHQYKHHNRHAYKHDKRYKRHKKHAYKHDHRNSYTYHKSHRDHVYPQRKSYYDSKVHGHKRHEKSYSHLSVGSHGGDGYFRISLGGIFD